MSHSITKMSSVRRSQRRTRRSRKSRRQRRRSGSTRYKGVGVEPRYRSDLPVASADVSAVTHRVVLPPENVAEFMQRFVTQGSHNITRKRYDTVTAYLADLVSGESSDWITVSQHFDLYQELSRIPRLQLKIPLEEIQILSIKAFISDGSVSEYPSVQRKLGSNPNETIEEMAATVNRFQHIVRFEP